MYKYLLPENEDMVVKGMGLYLQWEAVHYKQVSATYDGDDKNTWEYMEILNELNKEMYELLGQEDEFEVFMFCEFCRTLIIEQMIDLKPAKVKELLQAKRDRWA